MVIFHSSVSLPEGNIINLRWMIQRSRENSWLSQVKTASPTGTLVVECWKIFAVLDKFLINRIFMGWMKYEWDMIWVGIEWDMNERTTPT